MTEPKYIDAEQFKRDNERLLHCDFPYLAEETLEELIDNAPAADVVEVVRCNDCTKERTCNFAQYQGADGYCSYGERKDG